MGASVARREALRREGKGKFKPLFISVITGGYDHTKDSLYKLALTVPPVAARPRNLKDARERGGGTPGGTRVWEIQPFKGDPLNARHLNERGITLGELKTYTPPSVALREIEAWLSCHVDRLDALDKFTLFGYGVLHASDFLRAFFRKLGNSYYGSFFHSPPVDIMSLAALALRDERAFLANFRMPEVARELGLHPDEDRMNDLEYTNALAMRMMAAIKKHNANTEK